MKVEKTLRNVCLLLKSSMEKVKKVNSSMDRHKEWSEKRAKKIMYEKKREFTRVCFCASQRLSLYISMCVFMMPQRKFIINQTLKLLFVHICFSLFIFNINTFKRLQEKKVYLNATWGILANISLLSANILLGLIRKNLRISNVSR